MSPSKRPKNGMSNACVHATNYIFNTAWFEDLFWYKKCLPAIETSIISRLDIALAAPKKQSFDFLDERGKRSRNDKQLTTRSVRHCSRREDDIVTYSAQYSILGSKIWLVHWKTPALDRSYTLLGDKLLARPIDWARAGENRVQDNLHAHAQSALSMRMQVILDSLFACPCSAPTWGGQKGEFRDRTMSFPECDGQNGSFYIQGTRLCWRYIVSSLISEEKCCVTTQVTASNIHDWDSLFFYSSPNFVQSDLYILSKPKPFISQKPLWSA